MAGRVRGEILRADIELRRFVRHQVAECEKLGFPKQAPFTRLVSSGTVRVTPPEDPVLEAVGQFFWAQDEVRRRVMMDRYQPCTEQEKARRVSMSPRRLRIEYDRLLTALSGFLLAKGV
jgi:hypothetical protein